MEKRRSVTMSPSLLSEEQFLCSICLDIFTSPVSTPCGHSFCMACISGYWDNTTTYQCPLCKETFQQRPDIHINRTLREITEQFKCMLRADVSVGTLVGSGHQSAVSDKQPSRQGKLPGDLFAEMKARFTRFSSTTGQARPLHPPPLPRRYSLSGPAVSTEVLLCSRHNQRLEIFCRTDQECICPTCMETEHQTHCAVPAKREWLIKKSQLGITEVELREMIQSRLKKLEDIRVSLASLQAAAERETVASVQLFTALVSSIEKTQAEILENIQMDRLAAERRAEGFIRDLELEIAELKKRGDAISQLLQSEDYILFLKSFTALCTPLQTKEWSSVTVSPDLCSAAMLRRMSQVVGSFQEEMRKLSDSSGPRLSPTQEETSRLTDRRTETDFRCPDKHHLLRQQPSAFSEMKRIEEYAVDVTLDPSTAHPRLILSEDGKQVKCGNRHQAVSDIPKRFDRVVCVLGRQGFTSGRHYWEVEVGEKTDWDLGVASHSSDRKGKITVSPSHGYWFLSLRDRHQYAFRTEPPTSLGLGIKPHKIGVFLDYEMGQISFYNVDTKSHIYTFIDTFFDTIYPFFSPCTNKSGKNDAPLTISPIVL